MKNPRSLIPVFFQLTVAQSFSLSTKDHDGEHHLLFERPLAYAPGKILSIYQDDGSMIDNIDDDDDEHDLEKRRFNAWAGKRSMMSKRRFNAWAGRR